MFGTEHQISNETVSATKAHTSPNRAATGAGELLAGLAVAFVHPAALVKRRSCPVGERSGSGNGYEVSPHPAAEGFDGLRRDA